MSEDEAESTARRPRVAGLLLAAGAGTRLGVAKGLLRNPGGDPRVATVCRQLRDTGCGPIVVVLGAEADRVRMLLPEFAVPVAVAGASTTGMGESLREGLAALADTKVDAVMVMLVDLPGVDEHAMRRLVESVTSAGGGSELSGVLARCTWRSRPGHPVLIGREHWVAASATAVGDQGARAILADAGVLLVECGDLGHGDDVDIPADLTLLGGRLDMTAIARAADRAEDA